MVKVFQEFAKDRKTKKKNQIKNNLAIRIFLLVVFVQFFVVEWIQRGGIFQTFAWLENYYIFLINFLLVALFCLFFIALLGSLRWGAIYSTLILATLSLTSMVKKQFLGEPLLPWDFVRYDQAFNLLPKIATEIVFTLIALGIITLIVVLGMRLLVPLYKLRILRRVLIMMMIIPIFAVLIFYKHTPIYKAYSKMDIEHIYWVQRENSLQNGFLLGFIMNIENAIIVEPEGYTEQEIERIFQEYNLSEQAAKTDNKESSLPNPNLIIIMNEAFWDPTILPDVSFSQDPIPFFRYLLNSNTSGTLVSSVFGGSTANVEFEILTGLSTAFLPSGSIAYQQYIQRPIPSLTKIFKDSGYTTTAIHPYHDWFYKRDEVYHSLGFDHFLSLRDFSNSEIRGEYIGDIEVSKRIIEIIQSTDQPQLIFAVTMQNHGPYPQSRYDSTDISISADISSEGLKILEVYSEGLKDADESLELLINNIRETDEPTIIVFFGDHLPFLGKDYLVYKQTGFIEGNENSWSLEENLKMKSVPLLIWSNYENNLEGFERLGSSFLGNSLLGLTGQRNNHIFAFAQQISQYLPVYDKTVSIDINGNYYRSLPDHLQKIENDYRLLQYDVLFGKEYYLKIQ